MPLSRAALPDTLIRVRQIPIGDLSHDLVIKAAAIHANRRRDRGRTVNVEKNMEFVSSNYYGRKRVPPRKPKPAAPVGFPKPKVPTPDKSPALLSLDQTIKGKCLRVTLSKQEYDLYEETWYRWISAHASDFCYEDESGNMCLYPGDEDDLHRICQETVNQMRMEMVRYNRPQAFDETAYHSSHTRMNKARESLASRRVDRTGSKAKGSHHTTNIALLAGQFAPEDLDRIRQKAIQDQNNFLEQTMKPREIIDLPDPVVRQPEELTDGT